MANVMALAVARDVHLRAQRGPTGAPRGAATSRGCASTRATRRTSRSGGRSTCSGSRKGRCASIARTTASGCAPNRSPPRSRRTARAGLTPLAIAAVAGSTNTGRWTTWSGSPTSRARESALAPRRRRVRRGRAALAPRRRPRARARARRHASPSTRTSGSSRPTTSARSSCARREDLLHRRSTAHPSTTARTARGRAARLVPVLDRGHPPVPGAEALDVVAAPRDRGARRPGRAQRRPRAPTWRAGAPRRDGLRPRGPSPTCRSSASATSPRARRRGRRSVWTLPGRAAAGARGGRGGLGERHGPPRAARTCGRAS